MIWRGDNITLLNQRRRQPTQIAPAAAVAMRKHHQRMFTRVGWRIVDRLNAIKNHIIARRLDAGTGLRGIP